MIDVLVGGAGPAGLAVASACARLGLRTELVAPRPSAPWPAIYGMWADEVSVLPAGARYATARARVHAGGERWLPREYAVLDNESVRAGLVHPEVAVHTGRLADRIGDAAVVIDATGAHRPGDGRRRAEQTAYGVVVAAEVAAPLLGPGAAVFMDWRQPAPGPATFLYAIPLPDGRVLLEETSLAARPGLGMAELRARLRARLARHGIDPGDAPVDRVRLPLARPAPRPHVIPFGAAAGLVHPATGYSVADSLRLAPAVASAVASGLQLAGAAGARRAVPRVLWSPAARAVYRLRRAGLGTLLALPPDRTAEFFALFFALPAHQQRAFLSEREQLAGTVAAMATMFGRASPAVRRAMVLHR
ncbi:lycopene cyclase family protein [Actinophytocola sediminis]